VTKLVEHWRWHGRSISAMLACEMSTARASTWPRGGWRSSRRFARESIERELMKGSQKPKKVGKKPPQKTLKQRRAEKREAAKPGRAFDV
jgi:hypothetical protein